MAKNVLEEVDPGSSVLFLGSGFSLESSNILGKNPPNGKELRKHFHKLLGYNADTGYDIQVLAEEFAGRDKEKLYNQIYRIFHIDGVSRSQECILKENWRRVYTTNYDNSVEIYRAKNGKKLNTFSHTEALPAKLADSAVIHLHGSVSLLTRENVMEQLVLGEQSYVKQYIERSPWFVQFQSDLRYASAIFIVGYSLSDYHISALLMENPSLVGKTFFVQRHAKDEVFERRVGDYGSVLFIGLEGFCAKLRDLPRPENSIDIRRLTSFRLIEAIRDRKTMRSPTALEVQNLLVYGTFDINRCASTFPEEKYIVNRIEKIQEVVESLTNYRSFLIDGRLGNGKTIFLNIVALALIERGYRCFWFREDGPTLLDELKLLSSEKKLAIFFDEFVIAQDVLSKIVEENPNAKLFIEIRTSIFEVRYHDVARDVPGPFARINLNEFDFGEVRSFKMLCYNAGVSPKALEGVEEKYELRDLLLAILESKHIKEKIENHLRPIFQNVSRKRVLLVATLLGKFHLSADAGFVRAVTGVDPYHEFKGAWDVLGELFEIGGSEFKIRSSIFADFSIRNIISPAEMAESLVASILASASRKLERKYRVLMSNLMQYSHLAELFRDVVGFREEILGIYERLRYDERVNDEPLFWLQYAIAAGDDDQWPVAERFIDAAYDRAAAREGFRTFQIDTQAFRICLEMETSADGGQPVERIGRIIELIEKINSMIQEDSHRTFAIRTLKLIGPFVEKRRSDLNGSERRALLFWMDQLVRSLERLPLDYRVVSEAGNIRERLVIARLLLDTNSAP